MTSAWCYRNHAIPQLEICRGVAKHIQKQKPKKWGDVDLEEIAKHRLAEALANPLAESKITTVANEQGRCIVARKKGRAAIASIATVNKWDISNC